MDHRDDSYDNDAHKLNNNVGIMMKWVSIDDNTLTGIHKSLFVAYRNGFVK